ncbi:MAG: flagellar basal body L-ring protein FlgH [Rhizobiaceae bacterium]|nr:flagellar basal body L-ring protein FlgH [Rhizobiaceae bacterium]
MIVRHGIAALSLLVLAGCSQTAELGKEPKLTPVGYGVVSGTRQTMTYPNPDAPQVRQSSLWDDRQSRLFTDARALDNGDILTVLISINDRAELNNESDRRRTSARTMGLSGNASWQAASTGGGLDLTASGNSQSAGRGTTERSEQIDMRVAAVVTDVLPNGNLLIMGSQEVRVNAELRILTIAGIVRPSDISADNTIAYDRIAEARVSYGGRGRLSEVQQPTWGQQVVDTVLPF